MSDDVDATKDGLIIRWHFFIKWAWQIVQFLGWIALGGHIYLTSHHFQQSEKDQAAQDRRLERIERAIAVCIEHGNECKK